MDNDKKNEFPEVPIIGVIVVALMIFLVVLATVTIWLAVFPGPVKEPGIYWDYPEGNNGEKVSCPVDRVMDQVPVIFRFTSLDNTSKYYLVYFTMKDTVNIAVFENVSERYVIIQAEEETYFLMRDDGEIVIRIFIKPELPEG